MCKYNVKFLIQETRKQGITKTAFNSGIKKRAIETWVYSQAVPSFANAVKWAKGLGYEFNMSKSEIFSYMKKFGLIKAAEASGINIRTIRSWRYAGKEPPVNKIEQIMTAIGKPLELIKQ